MNCNVITFVAHSEWYGRTSILQDFVLRCQREISIQQNIHYMKTFLRAFHSFNAFHSSSFETFSIASKLKMLLIIVIMICLERFALNRCKTEWERGKDESCTLVILFSSSWLHFGFAERVREWESDMKNSYFCNHISETTYLAVPSSSKS